MTDFIKILYKEKTQRVIEVLKCLKKSIYFNAIHVRISRHQTLVLIGAGLTEVALLQAVAAVPR